MQVQFFLGFLCPLASVNDHHVLSAGDICHKFIIKLSPGPERGTVCTTQFLRKGCTSSTRDHDEVFSSADGIKEHAKYGCIRQAVWTLDQAFMSYVEPLV